MNCERVIAVFDELAADTLSGSELDEVVEHISRCPLCAQAFREYTAVIQLASTLNPAPPPPGVAQRLREFIAEALRRREQGSPPERSDELHPPATAPE